MQNSKHANNLNSWIYLGKSILSYTDDKQAKVRMEEMLETNFSNQSLVIIIKSSASQTQDAWCGDKAKCSVYSKSQIYMMTLSIIFQGMNRAFRKWHSIYASKKEMDRGDNSQ